MKLFVLELINGPIYCVGIIAEDKQCMMKLMNLKNDKNLNEFKSIKVPDISPVEADILATYNVQWSPIPEKYRLIFECDIKDKPQGVAFRIEE